MQPHIDARKQTINNVRFTTLNLPPLSIVPRPIRKAGLGTRFFQVLGALVWLLIAIVAIGRCSANAQSAPPEPPSGWIFPQGNGWIVPPQSPDTLRCRRLGVEFVCTDRRQETTCRLVGLEWVCDRRSRF